VSAGPSPALPLAEREAEEEADARRGGRNIDDRRRRIDDRRWRLIVAIGLIVAIAIGRMRPGGGAILPVAALLVPMALIVLIAERQPRGEPTQDRRDGERQYDLAHERATLRGPCG
jgi:hypothetical protein